MGIARATLAVLEIIFQVAIRFRHFLQIRHRGWGQQRASQVRMHNDPGGIDQAAQMVRLLCLQARLHLLQDGGKLQRQGLERRLVCGL